MDLSLSSKEIVLFLPVTLIRWCVSSGQDLIGLMRMSVTVIRASYNSLGLIYFVEGRTRDIDVLLDLGFMEWK